MGFQLYLRIFEPMLGYCKIEWGVSTFKPKPGFGVPLTLSFVATSTCFAPS